MNKSECSIEEKYRKVARWIVLDSDTPIEEVEWLLEKIYNNTNLVIQVDAITKEITDKCEPNINDDYGDVLKFTKEGNK